MTIEHRDIPGTAPGEQRKRLFIDWCEQWSGLNPFHSFNWRNFTLIDVSGEWAKYAGRMEVEIFALGVGVRVTFIYDHSFSERMVNTKTELERELMARTGATEVVDLTGGGFETMCKDIDAERTHEKTNAEKAPQARTPGNPHG